MPKETAVAIAIASLSALGPADAWASKPSTIELPAECTSDAIVNAMIRTPNPFIGAFISSPDGQCIVNVKTVGPAHRIEDVEVTLVGDASYPGTLECEVGYSAGRSTMYWCYGLDVGPDAEAGLVDVKVFWDIEDERVEVTHNTFSSTLCST